MGGKTVVIDASAAWTGGGLSRIRELLAAFPTLAPGHRYILVATKQLVSALDDLAGITVALVPPRMSLPPLRVLWEQFFLPVTLRNEPVDWVLSPFNLLPLGPGMRKSVSRAVIISSIAPFSREFTSRASGYQAVRLSLLRWLTYRSLVAADKVFLLSKEARNVLQGRISRSKCSMLPMSPPPPTLLKAASRVELSTGLRDRPFFLIVGDVLPHKGHEDAIRALHILEERRIEVQLVVVGRPLDPDYFRELRLLTDGVQRGSVTFLGSVSQLEVLALMREALATLIPSRIENTSRVPVEAMASQSPIVAADIPNLREACGDAAMYYPLANHARLAESMMEMLDSRRRDQLVKEGWARIQTNDWLGASRRILQEMSLI